MKSLVLNDLLSMEKNMMPWFAHSLKGQPETSWETQMLHARAVAATATRHAKKFCSGSLGDAAGSLHDLGKYVDAFQEYIKRRSPTGRGPDHSSAGAVYARGKLRHKAGRILAHVIAGHHAGLKDQVLGDNERLDRKEADLLAIVETARRDGFDLPSVHPKNKEKPSTGCEASGLHS